MNTHDQLKYGTPPIKTHSRTDIVFLGFIKFVVGVTDTTDAPTKTYSNWEINRLTPSSIERGYTYPE